MTTRGRWRAPAGLAVLLIWGGWFSGSGGGAQGAARPEAKIARHVAERASELTALGRGEEAIPVIVQTWISPGAGERGAVESIGGSVRRTFSSVHALSARLPAKAVQALARSPRVKRISYDWPVAGALDTAAVSTGAAAAALSAGPGGGVTGRGVAVAVLDSGVEPVGDLGPPGTTLVAEVDIVEPDGRPADPFGHGTHVAGIIAGSGAASSGPGAFRTFRGIAPGARIVSVKVLNAQGWGTVGEILAGVDWVLLNHEALGIRVMNLSLGHPVEESYATDPLCQALETAWRAGITVVVSAGNLGGHGYATITSPANDPLVITVGAAQDWGSPEVTDDLVASFSSRGPTAVDGVIKPDILAPGSSITSLRSPGSYLDAALPHRRAAWSEFTTEAGSGETPYISLSGTSMAAPVVAGAAALLLQQDPEATPDDVKARLMAGAVKIDDAIVARGAGLLDVGASLALGAAGVVSMDSRSPRLIVTVDADGTQNVEIQEIGTAWGDPATWSSLQVWGEIAIWGVGAQWSDTAVWGEIAIWGAAAQTVESQIAIWGSP
jgi:serine protease AprX